MERNSLLCRCFVRHAKEFLAEFPQVRHDWVIHTDDDYCVLTIPKETGSGFPVTVEVNPSEIMVMAGGAHREYELRYNKDPDKLVAEVLGFVRDLLSPVMRIKEYSADGKPYQYAFQVYHNEPWITEEWIGLFFRNYFGKRSDKIYQNDILPARDHPIE